jgi:non-ribosomal peptide synthetase component F
MVLVAAVVATLYRWTGQSDITIGTPAANREQLELENLIGFFSNTLPLRVEVAGDKGFDNLVQTVRSVALGAFDHQALPFERIVAAVAPQRDPQFNPLFQVNVRVQSEPPPIPDLGDAEVELVHVDLGYSRFDLAVEFQLYPDRLAGYVEYNVALFESATAVAFVDALEELTRFTLEHAAAPLWTAPTALAAPPRIRRR